MPGETQDQMRPLHIAMYPLFAHSHITSFLHLANKLAERGCRVSFLLPPKSHTKLATHNHHLDLITFIPISVPHVTGLPEGAETTDQVQARDRGLIMTAMDRTQDMIKSHLASLKPDFVFHDFAYWVPSMARKFGIKSLYYAACYMVYLAYISYHARNVSFDYQLTEADLMDPPPCFPSPVFGLRAHEARGLAETCGAIVGDERLTMLERYNMAIKECDGLAVRTCKEMEGAYCDYFEKHFGKPVLPTGLSVRTPPVEKLEEELFNWFKGLDEGSVIYCAIGSEWVLEKDQFQELLLGLELTGRPFLAVLRTPEGCETLEAAMPEGYKERTKGKGIIHGGWVQQQLILQHPTVGCFVTHCGAASLSEAMGSHCQLVFMPFVVDQQVNARMLSLKLKVGVEIDTTEKISDDQRDGLFTRDAVYKAIETVMDDKSEIAKDVRTNHANLRDIIMGEGFEQSYITDFIHKLHNLLGGNKHMVN